MTNNATIALNRSEMPLISTIATKKHTRTPLKNFKHTFYRRENDEKV